MRRVPGERPIAALGPNRAGPNPTIDFPYRKASTDLPVTESHVSLYIIDAHGELRFYEGASISRDYGRSLLCAEEASLTPFAASRPASER